VSDVRRIGLDHVDYGWGWLLYNGPPKAWELDYIPGAWGSYVPFNFRKGEHGIVLVISLIASVTEGFTALMEEILEHDPQGSPPQLGIQVPRNYSTSISEIVFFFHIKVGFVIFLGIKFVFM